MRYNDLPDMLVRTFPNLKKEVDFFLEHYGDLYHVLLENVLCPYVNSLLDNDSQDELKYVFDFYENMALSEDEEVKNLLQVTLIENLIDKGLYKKAEKYMHTNTKAVCKSVENYLRV